MSTKVNKKLLIVGDKDSGKTSLLHEYMRQKFSLFGGTVPPFGSFNCGSLEIKVNGEHGEVLLMKTDDSDYNRHETYFDADVIVMCFSIDNQTSLNNIIMKWNPEMKRLCPGVPIVLVGNKQDLRHPSDVTLDTELVKQGNGPAVEEKIGAHAYFECSAKLNINVSEMFYAAVLASFPKEKKRKKSLHITDFLVKQKCCYTKLE